MHEICHLMNKLSLRRKLSWCYCKSYADKNLQSKLLKRVLALILYEDQHLNICFILMKRINIQFTETAVLFSETRVYGLIPIMAQQPQLPAKLTVAVNAKANLKLAFTVQETIPANTYAVVLYKAHQSVHYFSANRSICASLQD